MGEQHKNKRQADLSCSPGSAISNMAPALKPTSSARFQQISEGKTDLKCKAPDFTAAFTEATYSRGSTGYPGSSNSFWKRRLGRGISVEAKDRGSQPQIIHWYLRGSQVLYRT